MKTSPNLDMYHVINGLMGKQPKIYMPWILNFSSNKMMDCIYKGNMQSVAVVSTRHSPLTPFIFPSQ